MEINNPIIKGFNPDPSICFDGENYFIVVSSFEYFPILPLYKSNNLVDWEKIETVIKDKEYLDLTNIKNSQGLFAPTIRYYEGTYFVVGTNITQGNFICYTEDPEGGWSAPIWIDCPFGIDPSLTFVNQTCYYQLTKFENKNEIIQFEINPFSGEVLSEIRTISYGNGGRDVEAPHVFKKDDWYYLVLAEGGTREGHMVTIQRSKNIWGPFKSCPYNPILTNRNVKLPLQSVGHADFIEDEYGDWWLVALATRPNKHFTLLGRETILLPVEWENDWPIVNENGTATSEVVIDRPIGKKESKQKTGKTNFFNEQEIKSLALPIDYSFDQKDVSLKNESTIIKLPRDHRVSYLSVSQADFDFEFSAHLKASELQNGKFGLMVYKDDVHYCKFGLEKDGSVISWFVDKQVLDLNIRERNQLFNLNSEYKITLKGNKEEYFLHIENEEEKIEVKNSIQTRHFTTEVSSSKFTGVQIGLFVEGETGVTTFYNTEGYYGY